MGFIVWKYNAKLLRVIEVMSGYAANESNYIDTIQGIAVIKSINKESLFKNRISAYFAQFQAKSINLGKTGNRFNLIVEVLSTIIVIAIMAETAYLTLEKTLKIGEMMAILSIGIGIIPSCTRLMLTNFQLQEAKVAYNRMYEFASIEPEDTQTTLIEDDEWDNKLERLELRNLTFRFAGRSQLLKNINLKINHHEIVAILGESGCGKSTLFQILQRFYVHESGYILINGKFSLNNLSTKRWRSIISVVPQEVKIFNCSILENICLSDNEDDFKTVFDLCEELKLGNYFNQFPNGLFTKVGEDGLNLSGGQKQILAFLRALFTKPQLLLLDEATAALDPKTEQFILELLIKLKSKMTILMIAHKDSTIKIADRIYEINNGVSKHQKEKSEIH